MDITYVHLIFFVLIFFAIELSVHENYFIGNIRRYFYNKKTYVLCENEQVECKIISFDRIWLSDYTHGATFICYLTNNNFFINLNDDFTLAVIPLEKITIIQYRNENSYTFAKLFYTNDKNRKALFCLFVQYETDPYNNSIFSVFKEKLTKLKPDIVFELTDEKIPRKFNYAENMDGNIQ